MTTERARRLYARRKGLIEPIFGILKEQLSARRFLIRGLVNVRAEFALLATAFNLRTLMEGLENPLETTHDRGRPASKSAGMHIKLEQASFFNFSLSVSVETLEPPSMISLPFLTSITSAFGVAMYHLWGYNLVVCRPARRTYIYAGRKATALPGSLAQLHGVGAAVHEEAYACQLPVILPHSGHPRGYELAGRPRPYRGGDLWRAGSGQVLA